MPAPELRIGGFTPLTTIDYPGELAAVIFCQGCPWRCRYCHNASLLPVSGTTDFQWASIKSFLHRRRGLLDAVVFSGGEPTAQPALTQAMRATRQLGYKVGLHSAGIYPRRLIEILPLVDWVGLDIKALPSTYQNITQVKGSGDKAWLSAHHIISSGISHEIRITVHPALTDDNQVNNIIERLEVMGTKNIVTQQCRTINCLDDTLNGT